MIKINNKTTLFILTTFATLLLLALPVQALNSLRVFPHDFINPRLQNTFAKLNTQSKFSWRYIEGKKELTRFQQLNREMLTFQKMINLIQRSSYKIDNFGQEVDLSKAYFNLREFNHNGTLFNVVTIEQAANVTSDSLLSDISPFNLIGTENYRNELNQQTKFNWRNVMMIEGRFYHAVTLEN